MQEPRLKTSQFIWLFPYVDKRILYKKHILYYCVIRELTLTLKSLFSETPWNKKNIDFNKRQVN